MQCPKCAREMGEEQHGEISIDRCPQCAGIWLDIGELEALIETDPRPLLAEDRRFHAPHDAGGPPVECPRCQGSKLIKLNSRLRPGVIIDSCTVCYGAWLDAGELTQLARADWAGRLRSLFGL